MRVLRWMILAIGLLGGALGLASTAGAAPLPSSAVVGSSIGEGVVTQAWWGRRRYGWGRRWGWRRPFYRPYYGWRRPYWRRPFYIYRRPFYRPWGWRRPYWGYRRPFYRPWGWRRWGWRRW